MVVGILPDCFQQVVRLNGLGSGYDQTEYEGFGENGESDLDLQYSMSLVGPKQTVTLYQAGDLYEGMSSTSCLFETIRKHNLCSPQAPRSATSSMHSMPHTARSRAETTRSLMQRIPTLTVLVMKVRHPRLDAPIYVHAPLMAHIPGPEDCGTVTPAYVMSTSYSYDEVELTPAYEQRQCAEYAKVSTTF